MSVNTEKPKSDKPKAKKIEIKPTGRDASSESHHQICITCDTDGNYEVNDITSLNIKSSEEGTPIVVEGFFEGGENFFDKISFDEAVNAELIAIPTGNVWVQVVPQDEEYYEVSYTNDVAVA